MTTIPKLSIRLSDSYKSALEEIKTAIDKFESMDDLYDPYMVEMTIRETCTIDDDYDFELDHESLYINISDIPKLKMCSPAVLSLLEYSFNESDLKLWFFITEDEQYFVFVKVPLSHIIENSRKY